MKTLSDGAAKLKEETREQKDRIRSKIRILLRKRDRDRLMFSMTRVFTSDELDWFERTLDGMIQGEAKEREAKAEAAREKQAAKSKLNIARGGPDAWK